MVEKTLRLAGQCLYLFSNFENWRSLHDSSGGYNVVIVSHLSSHFQRGILAYTYNSTYRIWMQLTASGRIRRAPTVEKTLRLQGPAGPLSNHRSTFHRSDSTVPHESLISRTASGGFAWSKQSSG